MPVTPARRRELGCVAPLMAASVSALIGQSSPEESSVDFGPENVWSGPNMICGSAETIPRLAASHCKIVDTHPPSPVAARALAGENLGSGPPHINMKAGPNTHPLCSKPVTGGADD